MKDGDSFYDAVEKTNLGKFLLAFETELEEDAEGLDDENDFEEGHEIGEDTFVDENMSKDTVAGVDKGELNSLDLLTYGSAAVFVQRTWGGSYPDSAADDAAVDHAIATADDFLRQAAGDGPLRVVVIDSDISGSFCAVLDGPVSFDDFFRLDWLTDDDVWDAANSALTS